MIKALLIALLEPVQTLKEMEASGDFTGRLALMEETKTLPFGAVWDYYCLRSDVPAGWDWMQHVRAYEQEVLNGRRQPRAGHVHVVRSGAEEHLGVAHPAQPLVALRTIGWHAEKIALLTPEGI